MGSYAFDKDSEERKLINKSSSGKAQSSTTNSTAFDMGSYAFDKGSEERKLINKSSGKAQASTTNSTAFDMGSYAFDKGSEKRKLINKSSGKAQSSTTNSTAFDKNINDKQPMNKSSNKVQSSMAAATAAATTTSSTAIDQNSDECHHTSFYCGFVTTIGLILIMFIFGTTFGPDSDLKEQHPIVPPEKPDLGFGIESATVSIFNLSTSDHQLLSSQWNITLSLTNPYCDTELLYIDNNVELSVLYKQVLVSATILQPYYEGTKDEWLMMASFGSPQVTMPAVDNWVSSAIAKDMIDNALSHGAMNFDIKVRSRIELYDPTKLVWSARYWMTATCKDVKIESTISSSELNGTIPGRLRNCSVTVTQ